MVQKKANSDSEWINSISSIRKKGILAKDALFAFDQLAVFFENNTYNPELCNRLCARIEKSINIKPHRDLKKFLDLCKTYYTTNERTYRSFQKRQGGSAPSVTECKKIEAERTIRLKESYQKRLQQEKEARQKKEQEVAELLQRKKEEEKRIEQEKHRLNEQKKREAEIALVERENAARQEKIRLDLEQLKLKQTQLHLEQKQVELQIAKINAEKEAEIAHTQHLKAIEDAKSIERQEAERKRQHELALKAAESKKIEAQTQQMIAIADEKKRQAQLDAIRKREEEKLASEKLAIKHQRTQNNFRRLSRVGLFLVAIALFITNYTFFFPAFDSIEDFIWLGIITYGFIDILAIFLVLASFRISKKDSDFFEDEDYWKNYSVIGIIVCIILTLIDYLYIEKTIPNFIFDIFEIFFAGLFIYIPFWGSYKTTFEDSIFSK